MAPRDPRLQAAALRLAADRVEHDGQITRELADAVADDIETHPDEVEELEAFKATYDATPEWHLRELERCDRDDSGGESWDVVRARILARGQRQSA